GAGCANRRSGTPRTVMTVAAAVLCGVGNLYAADGLVLDGILNGLACGKTSSAKRRQSPIMTGINPRRLIERVCGRFSLPESGRHLNEYANLDRDRGVPCMTETADLQRQQTAEEYDATVRADIELFREQAEAF